MSDPSDPTARADGDATRITPTGAVPPGAMRVGDTERSSALEALGEHLSAGRITIDEYGDRSARVTVARTADDLVALFDDLPTPHPVLPGPASAAVTPARATAPAGPAVAAPPAGPPATVDTRSTAQKLVAAAAAASVFVALVLFFVTGWWYWFLMIPAISAIAGRIWGPEWKEPGSGSESRRRELGR